MCVYASVYVIDAIQFTVYTMNELTKINQQSDGNLFKFMAKQQITP